MNFANKLEMCTACRLPKELCICNLSEEDRQQKKLKLEYDKRCYDGYKGCVKKE